MKGKLWVNIYHQFMAPRIFSLNPKPHSQVSIIFTHKLHGWLAGSFHFTVCPPIVMILTRWMHCIVGRAWANTLTEHGGVAYTWCSSEYDINTNACRTQKLCESGYSSVKQSSRYVTHGGIIFELMHDAQIRKIRAETDSRYNIQYIQTRNSTSN